MIIFIMNVSIKDIYALICRLGNLEVIINISLYYSDVFLTS